MRKSWFIKSVFAAAVVCTVIAAMLINAVIILQNIYILNLAAVIAVICFLLWEFHYSLTHDSLGRKIKPPAEPIYKKTEVPRNAPPPYIPTPTGRFVFDDEDFFFERMVNIANRFKLRFSYEVSDYDNEYDYDLRMYEVKLTGKYNFKLLFSDNMISIAPIGLNIHNYYTFDYSFELLDDYFYDKKAHKYIYADRGFSFYRFTSNIMLNDMSDGEIFDIVEKIIEALYGARSMKCETIEADDGKESFVFYLDAPDYYGYTETTEIGNFKFILNKENGGN